MLPPIGLIAYAAFCAGLAYPIYEHWAKKRKIDTSPIVDAIHAAESIRITTTSYSVVAASSTSSRAIGYAINVDNAIVAHAALAASAAALTGARAGRASVTVNHLARRRFIRPSKRRDLMSWIAVNLDWAAESASFAAYAASHSAKEASSTIAGFYRLLMDMEEGWDSEWYARDVTASEIIYKTRQNLTLDLPHSPTRTYAKNT